MGDDSPCPPGHNTPLPLKRSPPASFKRLLGGLLSHHPLQSRSNLAAPGLTSQPAHRMVARRESLDSAPSREAYAVARRVSRAADWTGGFWNPSGVGAACPSPAGVLDGFWVRLRRGNSHVLQLQHLYRLGGQWIPTVRPHARPQNAISP